MRMKLLLPLFDWTIEHEKLDWLTNIIVWLGGKKNYDTFYQLPR
jgi:hypothetical protein